MLSRSNTLKSSAGQTEHSSQKTMNIIGESVLEAFCLQYLNALWVEWKIRIYCTLEYNTDLDPDLMLYVSDQTEYPNEQSSKLLKILPVTGYSAFRCNVIQELNQQ